MSERTRQFIIRTLAIHAILLGAVLTVVLAASHSIYASTEDRELKEATQQQELLAEIAGQGIGNFYNDVWSDLVALLPQPGVLGAGGPGARGPGGNPNGGPGVPPPGGIGAPGVGSVGGAGIGGTGAGGSRAGGLPPAGSGGPRGGGGARSGRGGGRGGTGVAASLVNGRVNVNESDLEKFFAIQQLQRQLQNRVTLLFVVDRGFNGNFSGTSTTKPAVQIVPRDRVNTENQQLAQDMVDRELTFLAHVSIATISPSISITTRDEQTKLPKDELVNLVCLPLGPPPGVPGRAATTEPTSPLARRLLVAIMPAEQVGDEFTPKPKSGKFQDTTSLLVDQDDRVVMSSDGSLVGTDLQQSSDEVLKDLRTDVADSDTPSYPAGGTLVTIVPVEVTPKTEGSEAAAVRWWLVMRTPQADIDADVSQLFQRTVYWGVFVVVAVTAILVSTAVQLIRSRSRLEHMQHALLTRELDQAREIQLKWLPPAGSMPAGLELSAVNHPASHISGDFYNWFDLPDGRTAVAIGDVTGHGMAAAFLMATTQLLVRNTMARVADPGKCLQEVNDQLCVQVFHGQFVSLLLMVLDPEKGILEIADAGHPPPVIVHGGKCEVMETVKSSLVMGVEQRVDYPTQRLPLPKGAGLLLYTDGVVEALSPGGERYLVSGLKHALAGAHPGAKGMIDAVVAGVNQHLAGSPLADDLTMVAIQLH